MDHQPTQKRLKFQQLPSKSM